MSRPGWHGRLAAALLFLAAGCGGTGSQGSTLPHTQAEIERVREEAAAHPSDPAAQRRLAEWEALGDGGDATRAEDAIAHATELAPGDVGLAYLRGVFAEQHGHADDALDAFLAVIAGAPASDDPLAPLYAESSLAYLHDLRTDAPRFVERVRPVVEAAFARPGHVGIVVRRQLLFWLTSLAIARGDAAEETRLLGVMGAPTEVRVAGPFGLTTLAPFDETLPAEGRGPLAARYDLGPGRGEVDTRTVTAEHGGFALTSHAPVEARGAGTRIVEATLHAGVGGRHVLAISATGNVQVSVDGEVRARVDRRASWHPSTIYLPLDLTAGDHEVELKISARAAAPTLSWLLDHAAGDYTPDAGLTLPTDPEGPLALFVTADAQTDRGDTVGARELLRTRVSDASSTALLSLAARIASIDPFVPDTRRSDDERRLVALAASRDPEAYWPASRQAALETGDVESLAARRQVADRFAHMATVQLGLAQTLASAGYVADADAALARAVALRPDACAVIEAQFATLAERGRIDRIEPLLDALEGCDATSTARFDLLLGRHDYAGARAELARLSPLADEADRRGLALRIARASGDRAEEDRLVAEEEAEAAAGATIVREVDRRYAEGRHADALAALEAEADRAPRRASDLRSLEYALSGRDVMDPWRVDGLDVVRRFEASGRAYDGHAAVLVFDYEVTRVFADGSALDLVHQIFRVQTAEGVEEYGSLNLSGRVLTVRAIGPDGSTREPDDIGSSTDMPPLEIGDYVEYEIVRDHAPVWGDAYESGGWVFQNFSSPFDHSEIVFVAPVDFPLVFDVRGPVPPPTVTEANGLRTSRFVMEQVQPLVQEPNWVAQPPVLPSLRAVARVTWERMYEGVYDGLLGLDVADPAADRLLEDEIFEHTADLTPRQRVQRIHRWVTDNVEPADGAFFQSAPLMLAARRGSRSRVMRYLFERAGLSARIVYARALGGEQPVEGAPDADVYDATLVMVTLPEGPVFLSSLGRGVAHDYLVPGLRGQDAIVIEPGLRHVTLPEAQGTPSSQTFAGTVDIAPNGVARATLTLTFAGGSAAELRTGIEGVAPAERAAVIAERFVPSIVPGGSADPESIRVEGLDDWEGPLSVSFVADTAGLIRPARDGFHVVPLFGSGLENAFARLQTRTTTELVGEVEQTVRLEVRGPGVLHAPEAAQLEGPLGARATLAVSRGQEGAIVLERRTHLPLALVPVATYPAFAQFCRAVTQLDQRSVVITPN
ncbi:MAG: hypothetical protein U0234_14500 [Sandaracinus sp.]